MYRRRVVATLGTAVCGTFAGCGAFRSPDSDQPFRFRATVVNETPTPERPPVVGITVTNTGDNSHVLTIANDSFPFATSEATANGGSLVLEPESVATRERGCWRALPRTLPRVSGRRFAPDESVTAEYAVVNHADGDDCWPAGAFEFTETYYLDPANPDTIEGGSEFEWGFTVVVDEPPSISVRDPRPTTGGTQPSP